MKIGIYGGTFNPPHLGHLAAARAAIAALDLDRLMLVPAAIPPHKELPEGTPPPADRLAMAGKLADALLLPKVAEQLAPLTRSEVVQVIGTKFVLYRPSHKKDKKDKIILVDRKGK